MKKVKLIEVDSYGSLDIEINMFITKNNYSLISVQVLSDERVAMVTYEDNEFVSPIRSDRKVLNG